MGMRIGGVRWLLLTAVSCGRAPDEAAPPASGPDAGITCVETEVPTAGGCTKPGVPADGCATGFVHDAKGGCVPTLPSAECPKGQLAIPGETACHEIAPCGAAPWGTIPAEADTIYVDAAYTGGASDGSRDKPFVAIAPAIAAAPIGKRPIVAIAAGTYAASVKVTRPVRLHGRCPSMVEIRGDTTAALELTAAAEVHGVALTGGSFGILAYDVEGVVIDATWIHDVAERGIDVEAPRRPANATVTNVLIEHAARAGIVALGAKITVERSVVRATDKIGTAGFGVLAQADPTKKAGAEIVLRRSLVQNSHEGGVAATGSRIEVEGSVVLDTHAPSATKPGPAVVAQVEPTSKLAGTLVVRTSLLSRAEGVAAAVIGSSLTLDRVTIRDVLSTSRKTFGVGVEATKRARAAISDSLIERSRTAGINVVGSDVTIERTALRNILEQESDGAFGVGLAIAADAARSEPASAILREVAIEHARTFGIMAHGAKLELSSIALRDIATQKSDARFGDGLTLSALETALGNGESAIPSEATLEYAFVKGAARASINVLGSSLALRTSRLSCGAFDLEVSRWFSTFGGGRVERDFTLDDRGDNVCGCERTAPCRAQTNSLEPAAPLK